MEKSCEICGKEFRTSQGLRGHKTLAHGIKAAPKLKPEDVRAEMLKLAEELRSEIQSRHRNGYATRKELESVLSQIKAERIKTAAQREIDVKAINSLFEHFWKVVESLKQS